MTLTEEYNIREDKDGNLTWETPMPEAMYLEMYEADKCKVRSELMARLN